MDQTHAIQSRFGAVADRYATSTYHTTAPDLGAMLEAEALRGDERVLDLGTGTGHTAIAFAPRVAEVVGLDLTEAMLEQARRLASEAGVRNVRFEVGDAMQMAFPDGSFDLVTCRVCAHHFADVRAAVREMARVLRPGGRLLLVDSVAPEDAALDTYLNCIELIRDTSHVRNYSVSQWRDMLWEVSLTPQCLSTWAVPLEFEDWVHRMGTPPAAVAELRALFAGATDVVRRGLGVRTGDECGFDIPIAFLRGTKPTATR